MIRGGYWGGAWGLSWAGAWGEAWLLLNQPYQELSLKGQVFVRSYLSSIHSVEVAERIVSAAKVNGLSVRDAEVAVAAKVGETVLHAARGTRYGYASAKMRGVTVRHDDGPAGQKTIGTLYVRHMAYTLYPSGQASSSIHAVISERGITCLTLS